MISQCCDLCFVYHLEVNLEVHPFSSSSVEASMSEVQHNSAPLCIVSRTLFDTCHNSRENHVCL